MSEKKDWEYWKRLKSFMLYEGVCLQRGHLPGEHPEAADTPTYNDKLINNSNDFALILASLRADKSISEEWSNISKWEAAHRTIARDVFLKHWKGCNLPTKTKLLKQAHSEDNSLNPRVRDNLLKMVIGMAINRYKYNPVPNKRSGAVAAIKSALDECGVPLDEQTILNYLREGAELLPSEFVENFRSR